MHPYISIGHALIHGQVLVYESEKPRRAEGHGAADARQTAQGVRAMGADGSECEESESRRSGNHSRE